MNRAERTKGDKVHAQEIAEEVAGLGRELRSRIPEVYAGYAAMSTAATGEGALSSKTKELIALAIAATRECDGCIAAHARNLAGMRTDSQEVAEAMGVVILMNGGPGTVWGPRALGAFEEWAVQG
jgi:AhpD family alkylhydroperoxidase